MGPPQDELGVPVPVRVLLAHTSQVAVAVTELIAYTTGFELQVAIRWRNDGDHSRSARIGMAHPVSAGGPVPDDLFRFGVQFADGRRGSSLGTANLPTVTAWRTAVAAGDPPPVPDLVLVPRGGGGGGRSYDQRYWAWPLPPPGTLTLACEWPAAGIGLTTQEIDAGRVLEAAGHGARLWPQVE